MYDQKNLAYVLTVLECIKKLFIYTEGISTAEELIAKDEQMTYNACIMLLSVIGEETKKLDQQIKEDHAEVPWRDITLMRNRIAHDYRGINYEITFTAINRYLEPLKQTLRVVYEEISASTAKKLKLLNSPYYRHLHYLKFDHE